jgi:hypothetical protein
MWHRLLNVRLTAHGDFVTTWNQASISSSGTVSVSTCGDWENPRRTPIADRRNDIRTPDLRNIKQKLCALHRDFGHEDTFKQHFHEAPPDWRVKPAWLCDTMQTVSSCRRFVRACYLHLQGRTIHFLWLLDTEDGENTPLRNVICQSIQRHMPSDLIFISTSVRTANRAPPGWWTQTQMSNHNTLFDSPTII